MVDGARLPQETSGHATRLDSFLAASYPLLLSTILATGQAPQETTLIVTGDVTTPLAPKAGDLATMDRQHVELPQPNGPKTVYEGVPLQAILQKSGIQFGQQLRGKALAAHVIAVGKEGHEVVFGLGELDPGLGGTAILVADTLNGGALAPDQGPLRLVIPGDKEGEQSVRMLEKLEVVKLLK